jgi:acetyl esterase/lipase
LALDPGDGAGGPAPRVAGCISFYGVYDFTEDETAHPPQLLRLLERRVMKELRSARPEVFADASPTRRVRADAPPFLVVHGRNDTLVPVATARAFVAALSAVSSSEVIYVELPFAQHAFDVFWSARTDAATRAAERFLFERAAGPRAGDGERGDRGVRADPA